MTPTSHPDATAFAARFLANPDDRLGRLVFADWLEERGDESSVAWADYIRTQAEMETLRWNDPAWDELTVRATERGRRVLANLRINVGSSRILDQLPKLIPPHRCVLGLRRFHPSVFVQWYMPESVAREHQMVPLHFDTTSGYLACPTPDDWELVSKLAFILNRNLSVFGISSAAAQRQLERAYSVAAPVADGFTWPLPVYDPTAELAELETLLNESIAAGVSVVSLAVAPNEWRHVRVVCFTRTGRRERERMHMLDFRRVVAGVMRRTVDQLPRSGPPGEFTHRDDGRTYLVSALAPTDGLTLWIRLRPEFDDLTR